MTDGFLVVIVGWPFVFIPFFLFLSVGASLFLPCTSFLFIKTSVSGLKKKRKKKEKSTKETQKKKEKRKKRKSLSTIKVELLKNFIYL